MSLHRHAAKRDVTEKPIVQALRAYGARVWHLSGDGCPDLLVLYRGYYTPLEVKSAKGRLRPSQSAIPWPVVKTIEEALDAIGAGKVDLYV